MLTLKKESGRFNFAVKAMALVSVAYLAGVACLVYDGLNDHIINADVIIVPGNKVELNGKPSPRLMARITKAAELFQQHKAPYIFVSGGTGKEGFDEAVVMADSLIAMHVPASHIIIDSQGINTLATAKNAHSFMAAQKLTTAIVVTQYFHIARTKLALRKNGITQLGSAHADYVEWRDSYALAREVVAYLSYLQRS